MNRLNINIAGNNLLKVGENLLGSSFFTSQLFGSLVGINKWYSGVLAPNGKIYTIPFDSTQVLEIDPVTQITALFGSLAGTGKWFGGVLAPNGKIYTIPRNSTQVLEIDPVTQTTALFGSLAGSSKWVGGVLAPNGKIYGIPNNSTQVLEIDKSTNTKPNAFDMVIPTDLADLATSNYNRYSNKL